MAMQWQRQCRNRRSRSRGRRRRRRRHGVGVGVVGVESSICSSVNSTSSGAHGSDGVVLNVIVARTMLAALELVVVVPIPVKSLPKLT